MFDFALTETGDLVFEKSESQTKPLRISFSVSDTVAFKIGLRTEDCEPLVGSANSMKISFDVNGDRRYVRALLLDDADARIQGIKIRIQTVVGDIAGRTAIGSRLEKIKHKPLYDKSVAAQAVEIVKEAIYDLMPDAIVKVQPEVVKGVKGYTQRMSIFIYEDDILIFKYGISG